MSVTPPAADRTRTLVGEATSGLTLIVPAVSAPKPSSERAGELTVSLEVAETVSVELFPPLPYPEPLMVRARVVQRFEPQADSSPNLLSGMGLELMDLPALIERLEPVMQRLRNPPT